MPCWTWQKACVENRLVGGDPEEKPPSSVIDVSQGPDGEWSVLVREAVGAGCHWALSRTAFSPISPSASPAL
jgi:hypothetical protein